MATITDTKLVLDEQKLVQDATNDDDGALDADNDVLLNATLISKLVTLGVDQISAGTNPTTGFPQVAVNTALLDPPTGATDLALSIPGDGEPSGLSTVDGVEIFLYNEGGIIYGREGTANGDPNPAGDLAFAVALDLSGGVSSAQVYLIQYEPLKHDVPDAIDDDDTLSFADGKITLDVTTTEFVTTFEPLDFSKIPSGSPQETLTVPTADLSDNHSALFDGIIFPAAPVDDPTVIDTNPGTNDDLNPDAVGFGVKGGQASQLNQNEGFFVQDAAWTSSDPDANEIGGIKFDIQGIGGVKSVNIEWWTVDDGAVVEHDTDTVSLPSGNAVFENFTIETTDSVDQIYVRFTYDTKPDTSGVRVENLEVAFPSTKEVTTVNHEDLGTHLVFEDAGPSISTPANSTVSFTANSSTGDVAITDSFGSDGAGAVSLIDDLPTGWVFDNTAHTSASLTVGGVKQFEIVVDNDSYNFTTLVDPVLEFQPLNFAAIASGGPQETLSVPTTSTTDNTVIQFNGLLFTNVNDPTAAANNPGAASTLDDLNPDNVGFGVKAGQASQINNNEGFFAQNTDAATEINGLRFDIAGIGNVKTVNVEYWLVDEGVVSAPVTQTVDLPKGNQVFDNFTIHSDTSVDQIYVRFFFDGDPTNQGVRILNFETEVAKPVPDQVFDFGLQITDKDGDHAATTTNFLIGVDGTDPDHTVAGV
jgi:hypothetical protein